MSRNPWMLRLWTAVAGAAVLACLSVPMSAQEKPETPEKGKTQRVPGVEDWSTHHLVFSNPGDFSEGTQNHSFTDWYKIQNDPRYQMFLKWRKADLIRPRGTENPIPREESVESLVDSARSETTNGFEPFAITGPIGKPGPGGKPMRPTQLKPKPAGDWNIYVGGAASAGLSPTFYPAKYTWDLNATPDCTKDFLVVPVNQASANAVTASSSGNTTSVSVTAGTTYTVTVGPLTLTSSNPTQETATIALPTSGTSRPAEGSSVTIGAVTYDFVNATTVSAPSGTNTCNVRSYNNGLGGGDSTTQVATNLYDAIIDGAAGESTSTWECHTGMTANGAVTATNPTRTVDLTSTTYGATGFTFMESGTTNFTTFTSVAGTDHGTLGSTDFAYWSGSSELALNTLASNLSALIQSNTATAGATSSYSSGDTFTVTSSTPGAAGSLTLGGTLTGAGFAWSTLTTGADGQSSIVAFNQLYDANAVAATQTGLVSSNGATSSSSVTITTSTPTVVTLNASAPVQATGTLTIAINPTNTEDVYIEVSGTGDEYAFHSAGNCGTAKCVIIGANAVATATALVAAIGGTCSSHCTGPDTLITATNAGGTSATVTITAVTAGTAGNSITITPEDNTGGNLTGGGNLAGGSAGTTDGSGFAYSGLTAQQLADNIVASINANTTLQGAAGVTASDGGTTTITLTANTAGTAGNSITLAENITGFAWNTTTLAGGAAQGPCGTGQPSVLWSYDASTAISANMPMLGSPVISLDGTQIAFIENASSGGAILHILFPKAGENASNLGASPVAPAISTTTAATYSTCVTNATTSCMFSVNLSNANTNSPPYYDYGGDALYVGDNSGIVHKVSPVFLGIPATTTWTATAHSAATLTGPVYDSVSGNVFVADSSGEVSAVKDNGASGTVSGTHITSLGAITDPVIVDSSTGHIYVFSGGSTVAPVVGQYTTSLAAVHAVTVGVASGASQLHAGTFDNLFYTSAAGTGSLYVCGKGLTGTNAGPVLYSIPITTGTMGTAVGSSLALSSSLTGAQQCSPLSEVYNPNSSPATDWLFVGIPSNCAFGGPTTGCVMSFNITSTFPATVDTVAAENGGTSGIIVDNVSATNGASNLYFTTLTAPGAGACGGETSPDNTNCVVKRTQNGLQ